MAKVPPKAPKPTPKKPKSETTETKLPPMTQKSMDMASKMDAEDTASVKKAKGGKVKFDFAKMIADKKKNAKGKKTPPKGKGC